VSQHELAEFEVEGDAEEVDERHQNGADYLSDDVLSMIIPETVPTPIFDSMEVGSSSRIALQFRCNIGRMARLP
jgi:hypothetical protein